MLALVFPGTPEDTAPGRALVVSVGLTLHPALTQEPGAAGRRLYMLHPIVAFQGECAPCGPRPASCRRHALASPPP